MSSFRVNPKFTAKIQKMRDVAGDAAFEAMSAAMRAAEKDAKALARWRDAGNHEEVGADGTAWRWTGTGVAQATITGYATGFGRSTLRFNYNSARSTVSTRKAGATSWYSFKPKAHYGNPSKVKQPGVPPGTVIGVVTMPVNYAEHLQRKETKGAVWGKPGPGKPATTAALALFWPMYWRSIIVPIFTKRLKAV